MTDEIKSAGSSTPTKYDFDSMNLQVGGKLQLLLVSRSAKPESYFSSLIGYIKDEYLIIKTPLDHGAPVLLRSGEQITVRTFSGINVCSFTATVDRIFAQPCFYFHLSFPRTVQGTSLRKAMRIKVDIPAELTEAGADSTTPVKLVNLSVAGALVESHQALQEDQGEIDLSFTVVTQPGNFEAMIDTKVAIRSTSMRKDDTPEDNDIHIYGMEFIDLDQTHQIILQNLIYEALVSDRQKIV